MKATGIVREIDQLGRFVIPKEIRNNLGIESYDPLEIFIEGDRIILKKYAPACIFCNEVDNVVTYHNKLICHDCLKALSDLA